MPGIVGCVTRRPSRFAELEVKRMTETLLHEEFYVSGSYSDKSQGIYVGWVARENAFSDGMPLRSEREDVVLVFSGEEYPDPNSILQLKSNGHEFNIEGASYLVHSYEDDPNFPAGLNGRFHGLVIDRNRGNALLFNDRYGMHRLYFYESSDTFYFASEAKAILEVRQDLKQIDPQSLGEFISCSAVLENRSLFKDIKVLPPAAAWIFRCGVLSHKGAYFTPSNWENQEQLPTEDYYQELRTTFAGNLTRYFRGHERIGMSLTGGLDTRMVLAWGRPLPGSLPCYTFGSMYRESQDVRVARQVAEASSQPFHILTAGQRFLSEFSRYARRTVYLTDGCMDAVSYTHLTLPTN